MGLLPCLVFSLPRFLLLSAVSAARGGGPESYMHASLRGRQASEARLKERQTSNDWSYTWTLQFSRKSGTVCECQEFHQYTVLPTINQKEYSESWTTSVITCPLRISRRHGLRHTTEPRLKTPCRPAMVISSSSKTSRAWSTASSCRTTKSVSNRS